MANTKLPARLLDASTVPTLVATDTTVIGNLTVDTNTLKVDSTNNRVGIGNASPGQLLTVGGITGGADGTLSVKTNSNTHAIAIEENSGNENYQIGVNSTGDLGFYNSGSATPTLSITDHNQVHIKGGASGSSYAADGADKLILEHSDSVAIDIRSPASSQALIMFSDGTRAQGLIGYNHSEDSIRFSNSGNVERMRIDSSGRVGINRTPAISNSKLEVGGADNVPLINVEASGATGGIGIGSSHLKFYYGTTEHMAIDGNGWIRLNGGNAQQYSDNQRTYSGNENITFSSSSSAQTWTSSYYQPYQKFNFAGLHFGYSGNGAISQHFYITLMNHYSGLSINTQHSASGGNGSSYHTISFTSGGAYNTRTLKVVCTPASGQNAANTSGTIYYGTCI